MGRQLITKEGYENLLKELKQLRSTELPAILLAIEEARAHGDLSENAEFHAANERQAGILAKIAEIEKILASAEIVDPLPKPTGRVIFGSHVTLQDLNFNNSNNNNLSRSIIYQIVGPGESNPSIGRISMFSPIGMALLGREESEIIEVHTPGGIRSLEIIDIN